MFGGITGRFIHLHLSGATQFRLQQLVEQIRSTIINQISERGKSLSSSARGGDLIFAPVPDINAFLAAAKLGEVTKLDLEAREVWIEVRSD